MFQQLEWAPVLGIFGLLMMVGTIVYNMTRKNKCPRPLCMEVGNITEIGFTVVNPEGGRRVVTRDCRYHGKYEVIEEIPPGVVDDTMI